MYKSKGKTYIPRPNTVDFYKKLMAKTPACSVECLNGMTMHSFEPYSYVKVCKKVCPETSVDITFTYYKRAVFDKATKEEFKHRMLLPLSEKMINKRLHPAVMGPSETEALICFYRDDSNCDLMGDRADIDWFTIKGYLGFGSRDEIKCEKCKVTFDTEKITEAIPRGRYCRENFSMIACAIWELHSKCEKPFRLPKNLAIPTVNYYNAVQKGMSREGEFERQFDFNEARAAISGKLDEGLGALKYCESYFTGEDYETESNASSSIAGSAGEYRSKSSYEDDDPEEEAQNNMMY